MIDAAIKRVGVKKICFCVALTTFFANKKIRMILSVHKFRMDFHVLGPLYFPDLGPVNADESVKIVGMCRGFETIKLFHDVQKCAGN